MFDWRVQLDAQQIIVAGELLAIYNRALNAKSRRGRNEHRFGRFPIVLRY